MSQNNKGFTLIELVVVIVILGVLSAVALPKFIDLTDDAMKANMQAMKGSLKAAETLVATQILIDPSGFNNAQNRYTLDNGQQIRVRGRLPDGRWNNTFIHLVDFEDIAQVSNNNCTDNTLKWCVRQRNQGWFNNRGYSNLGEGRGFVIFPYGYNVNQDSCYVYYMNQNGTAAPESPNPSIVGTDFSEC